VRSQSLSGKASFVLCSFALGSALFAKNAEAEKILAHDGDWTVFSDGRAGAFVSYVHGDGFPENVTVMGHDSTGAPVPAGTITIRGGGENEAATEQQLVPGTTDQYTQGTIERMRIRSGMIANTFGFGVRGPVTEHTTVKGYIQVWAWVENAGEQRGAAAINTADVRQGYVKLEGLWGSVLVGRSRGLFSRAATDIDVLYGHGYGVGYPGNSIDSAGGPTQGQIGFGLLGSQFSSGVVYATPLLYGFQLSVGAFDPVQLQGAWPRTKWARPEAELTFERPIGDMGKFLLFANGTYQRAYKTGANASGPDYATAGGATYGGRLELGPVHLGLSG
jgi:Gram-negative porin